MLEIERRASNSRLLCRRAGSYNSRPLLALIISRPFERHRSSMRTLRLHISNHRLLLALLAVAVCGCADVAPPRVFHPGTMEYQQGRAQRFDPYPMRDMAPDLGGGRPLQYDRPAPLTEQ